MEKIVYYDVELKRFLDEIDVRRMLFSYELKYIENNIDDFKNGELNLEEQLNVLRDSMTAIMDVVLKLLLNNWEVKIKKYKEVD